MSDVRVTDMTATKNEQQRGKKVEAEGGGQLCRNFIRHSPNVCAVPLALNHDINSKRALACWPIVHGIVVNRICRPLRITPECMCKKRRRCVQATWIIRRARHARMTHSAHASTECIKANGTCAMRTLIQNRWVTTWPDDANNDSITKFCTSSIDTTQAYGFLMLVQERQRHGPNMQKLMMENTKI